MFSIGQFVKPNPHTINLGEALVGIVINLDKDNEYPYKVIWLNHPNGGYSNFSNLQANQLLNADNRKRYAHSSNE